MENDLLLNNRNSVKNINDIKNNIICFLLKFISSFEIILETETIK